MVISVKKHKIAYMALPKAACSSVKAAIAQIDPEPRSDGGFTCEMKWHAMYPTQRFRRHRWKAVGDDWYKFCVVRDPVQRLLSCYQDRVVERRNLYHSRNIRRGLVNLPALPDPDFFFLNLTAYRKACSVIKHHSLPSWVFLGQDLSIYDDVFRISQLPQLAQKLEHHSGQTVSMTRENATSQKTKLTLDDLMPRTRKFLKKTVAAEYAYLADYFDNPFEPEVRQMAA
jgi:hypothetical protein